MALNDDYRESFTEEDCKIGRLRRSDEVYPYASGRDEDLRVHNVKAMLFYQIHFDRALWALKTTQGRIIVVMQQYITTGPSYGNLIGEVELINAPFPSSAVVGLKEDILDLRGLVEVLSNTSSL